MTIDPKRQKMMDGIIAKYIGSSSGRQKLAEAMIAPIRQRRYGVAQPCPHDGHYCNVSGGCESQCERQCRGDRLEPRFGYPIDSDEYFRLKVINKVLDA